VPRRDSQFFFSKVEYKLKHRSQPQKKYRDKASARLRNYVSYTICRVGPTSFLGKFRVLEHTKLRSIEIIYFLQCLLLAFVFEVIPKVGE
jgi:hypothetical protein